MEHDYRFLTKMWFDVANKLAQAKFCKLPQCAKCAESINEFIAAMKIVDPQFESKIRQLMFEFTDEDMEQVRRNGPHA